MGLEVEFEERGLRTTHSERSSFMVRAMVTLSGGRLSNEGANVALALIGITLIVLAIIIFMRSAPL